MYVAGLCVGMIVGAYWARVLRMVVKSRRQTGRAANFLPPEPLGQALRIVWYPTVVIWIVHPFMSAFGLEPLALLRRLYQQPAIQWCGVVMAAAALAATLVCWKRMGKSWRMGIDPDETTQLIVSGPYGYVRHPIYALSSLLMLATVAVIPTPLMLVVAAIHLSFLQWEARREEQYLVRSHGADYETYLANVGRFVPRSLRTYSASARNVIHM